MFCSILVGNKKIIFGGRIFKFNFTKLWVASNRLTLQIVQTYNKEDFDEFTRFRDEIWRSQLKNPEIEERPLRRQKRGVRVWDGGGDRWKIAKDMVFYSNVFNLLFKDCFLVF